MSADYSSCSTATDRNTTSKADESAGQVLVVFHSQQLCQDTASSHLAGRRNATSQQRSAKTLTRPLSTRLALSTLPHLPNLPNLPNLSRLRKRCLCRRSKPLLLSVHAAMLLDSSAEKGDSKWTKIPIITGDCNPNSLYYCSPWAHRKGGPADVVQSPCWTNKCYQAITREGNDSCNPIPIKAEREELLPEVAASPVVIPASTTALLGR